MDITFSHARVRAHHAAQKCQTRSARAGVSPDCVGGPSPSSCRVHHRGSTVGHRPQRL